MSVTMQFTPSGADISLCGRFRYRLWRRWHTGRLCVWVMLNPSTADADTDDATIRRCIGFAKQWGYSGIEVVNLYALRCTDPKKMLREPDRSAHDVENTHACRSAVRVNRNAMCAWGNNAEPAVADLMVTRLEGYIWAGAVRCLGVTRSGQPRHPVRLAYATERVTLAFAQGRMDGRVSNR